MLEAILPVPLHEMWMRTIACPQRQQRVARSVQERVNATPVIDVPRDEYLQIVVKADKAAIEHPVDRTRQR